MGECQFWITLPDGTRKYIIDIGPNYPRFDTAEEGDSGSIINGGPGVPVVRTEGKR